MTFEKANDERGDTVKKHTPKIRVEDLKRLSVFEVPQDYFLHLPAQIQARLAKDKKWPQSTPFLVPEGYFAQLPQEIGARLKPFTSALPEKARVPFVVPGDFFAGLSEAIAQKIATHEAPEELPASAKTTPEFYLPEAYFETLPRQIDRKIRAVAKKEYPQAPLRPLMYLAFALLGMFLVYRAINWSVKRDSAEPTVVQKEVQNDSLFVSVPDKLEKEQEEKQNLPQSGKEMPVIQNQFVKKRPVSPLENPIP
ncbi:MAG: hypothetical protein HC913_10275 [Microscillaceae bacterium]|nr:hypothetical protein [Microscillaceae bacterium]